MRSASVPQLRHTDASCGRSAGCTNWDDTLENIWKHQVQRVHLHYTLQWQSHRCPVLLCRQSTAPLSTRSVVQCGKCVGGFNSTTAHVSQVRRYAVDAYAYCARPRDGVVRCGNRKLLTANSSWCCCRCAMRYAARCLCEHIARCVCSYECGTFMLCTPIEPTFRWQHYMGGRRGPPPRTRCMRTPVCRCNVQNIMDTNTHACLYMMVSAVYPGGPVFWALFWNVHPIWVDSRIGKYRHEQHRPTHVVSGAVCVCGEHTLSEWRICRMHVVLIYGNGICGRVLQHNKWYM